MIETGDTDEEAKKEIIKRYKSTLHKRQLVPTYKFDRKNYLMEEN